MPAVLDKPAHAEKYASEVDEQLAQAASRIRIHDLAFGGILIAATILVYATAMIAIDKYAVLPEWVRQLGLLGLLAAIGATAYLAILRPLRRRVNPMYAAVQVEKTIDDAKNSVVGYVEAQNNGNVHPAVKAAMGARAAKSVGEADVNHAVDHRSLIYAGGVAVVFLLALIVLFFVFRPAQFRSLAARTFAPFTAEVIAARTQLTLLEPEEGNVTITAGQSVTVKVNVGGKVPSTGSPDRLRVMIRHNQATAEYEELAMEKGETSRDWRLRVPDYLVRNGFWYKVAGGDAETAEYRVAVRSLPLFTDYEVLYEYPAYTRLKPETTRDAHLRALRGTKVAITGRTNRTVKDGKIAFDPPTRDALPGKLLADKPDSIQFSFALTTSGMYRPTFTSSEGERSPEPPPFKIAVDEDQAPTVEIVKPVEEEIAIPANGLLAVDAAIVDDIGIEKLALKMRLAEPVKRDLADKPFQEGKSFRRPEKDGTFSWPTSLEYKDSVDFNKLADASGQPVVLKEGTVLEYWLEATDNRTKPGASGPEPDPNTGKSIVKRVRIAPPVMAMEEKKNLDEKRDRRKNEEKAHADTQQKQLDTEKRDPPQPNAPQPKSEDGAKPMMPDPMPKDPMLGDPMPKKKMEPEGTPMPKDTGNPPPMMPPMNMDATPTAPPPSTREDRDAQQEADRIQDKLNEQKGGGSAKPGPKEEDRANPAEPKPPMMMGGTPPPADSDPKAPPKPNDPANPTMGSSGGDSKPMGAAPKPEDPASPKPDPKTDPSPMNPMGGTPPSEPKPTPKDMDPKKAGSEKPTPMMDPTSMDGGKPMPGTEPAGDAAKPKPMPGTDPGMEKPEPKPMTPQDPKNKPEEGGMAKPQAGPQPADAKPVPKDGKDPMPGSGEGDPKPMPADMGMPGASETKSDGAKPPMGGAPEKGIEKPSPNQKPMPGSGQKPTPEQMKEFQDAVKDLASKDDKTKQAAQDKLDKMVGEKNRKDIEKEVKDFEKNVQNLNSKDDKTKKDAQDKLDKQIGEKNRRDIEDIQKGLNSKNPMEKAAAEEKLNDLQAKAGAGDKEPKPQGGGGDDPKPKIEPKELDGAMKDLQSPDKEKRDAAKEKLDKALGKGAGDKAEQFQNDLKSEDKEKRAAAETELNQLKKQAEEFAKNNPPKKENGPGGKKVDPKEVERALDDLNNDDPKKRELAKKDLDDMLGKGTGDKAEEFNKKAKSEDLKDQADGRKGRDDLLTKAEEMAKEGEPKPKGDAKKLSKDELDKLAKMAEDLNSMDEAKRKAAEQEFDKQLGKAEREKLQELAKDPKKAQDVKNEIEKFNRGNGDPTVPVREAMREDARNRAKSAQLQLEQFEKNKDNKQLLEDTGMTPAQYEEFLKKFRERTALLKKEADDLEKTDPAPKGPATANVSGGGKIDSKGGASTGNAGGPTVAAPGYGKALEEFRAGTLKGSPKK